MGRHPKPFTKTEVSGLARHVRFTLRCRYRQPALHVRLVPWHKVAAIGIGGSLAAPPLPPHRTYGSVYGGSRSYADALRSNDSTRVGWAFGLIHRRERFDVFPSRLPGFTRRRR